MSARWRTRRDWRRRRLGQNFLDPALTEEIVEAAGLVPGELVLEIGAGSGVIAKLWRGAPPRRRARSRLAREIAPAAGRNRAVRVVARDFLSIDLPRKPSCAACWTIRHSLQRADVSVQREVAQKRGDPSADKPAVDSVGAVVGGDRGAAHPCAQVPAGAKGRCRRALHLPRDPPLLQAAAAAPYAAFMRREWPF